MYSQTMKWNAIIVLFFFVLSLPGCYGTANDDDDDTTNTDTEVEEYTEFRTQLTAYNTSVDDLHTWFENYAENLNSLDTALNDTSATDDAAAIGSLIDEQAALTDQLNGLIAALEDAETNIQNSLDSDNQRELQREVSFAITTGAILFSLGAYLFAKKSSDLKDKLLEQRSELDEISDKVLNLEDGASEAYAAKKEEMQETGKEAIQTLASKVTTDLVLSGVNPASTGGVILKEVAGNTMEEGLSVISSTKTCETDSESDDCKIGITKTDSDGKAKVPAGEVNINVSGEGISRVVAENIEVNEDEEVEVVREVVTVDQATPEIVAANDEGTYVANSTTTTTTTTSTTTTTNPDPGETTTTTLEGVTYAVTLSAQTTTPSVDEDVTISGEVSEEMVPPLSISFPELSNAALVYNSTSDSRDFQAEFAASATGTFTYQVTVIDSADNIAMGTITFEVSEGTSGDLYDGTWSGSATPNPLNLTDDEGDLCPTVGLSVTINGTSAAISMNLLEVDLDPVAATVDDNGQIEMSTTIEEFGSVNVSMNLSLNPSENTGSGNWSTNIECSGDVSLTRP